MEGQHFYDLNTRLIWSEASFGGKLLSSDYEFTWWDQKCLRAIWQFNQYKGQLKFLSEARVICGYDGKDLSKYPLKQEKRDLAAQGFYFGLGTYYEINKKTGINEPIGISLQQDLAPDYANPDEMDHFLNLFPFRFLTFTKEYTNYMEDFLFYHLSTTFKGKPQLLKSFLLKLLVTRSAILADYARLLEDFIAVTLPEAVSVSSFNEPKGFGVCLHSQFKDLLPYLVREFGGKKPKDIAHMLLALCDLRMISPGLLTNQTDLYKRLKISFGSVGSRTALNSALRSEKISPAKLLEVKALIEGGFYNSPEKLSANNE